MQDNFQWVRGNHSIKAGFQHQRLQDNYRARWDGTLFIANFSNAQTAGFNNGTLKNNTGNSYASYLLGTLNSSTVNEDSVVTSGARYRNYAWWVGDDWKVTRNLTLNLGLRHDIMLPYVEVRRPGLLVQSRTFRIRRPAGSPARCSSAAKGSRRSTATAARASRPITNNWGPRLGFAYRLGDKTVVRAGYGMMYTRHGAVGGRGGAREGTGKLGFTAAPGFPSPDTFSPAFDWDDGVPAYQKPPFFDADAEYRLHHRQAHRRQRGFRQPRGRRAAAALSELELFHPARDHIVHRR